MAAADVDTKKAIQQANQTAANNAALAEATSKNMNIQAQAEFRKSMAEMAAKSVKSSGESLKGLA